MHAVYNGLWPLDIPPFHTLACVGGFRTGGECCGSMLLDRVEPEQMQEDPKAMRKVVQSASI